MSKKKYQTAGLLDNSDLILPGQDQEMDENNLVSTVPEEPTTLVNPESLNLQNPKSSVGQQVLGSGTGDLLRQMANPASGGAQIYNIGNEDLQDNYTKYIDQPFSVTDQNIDDRRADGQSVGEKVFRAYGVKMPTNIVTNVVGSTVGLIWGAGEVLNDFAFNGPSKSNLNKFFNNDFQRSLDGINESVGEALPHYYSRAEREMGIFDGALGTANFWTDGFQQGLSFVAGAVISEFATAGLASALIPARAANHLKRISQIRNQAYAQKSAAGLNAIKKIDKAENVWNGLTAARRVATGAFYESGVEARHNYDQTIHNLTRLHMERTGQEPDANAMKEIREIAEATSNSVFAANAALVGYSNFLMFPRIFGKGMRANQKSFKNQIKTEVKDGVTKYKAAYKDFGRFKNIGKHAWALSRIPLYEGFVEEGGQKWADISGQKAAESYYINGQNPDSLSAVGGLLAHTWDSFGEAYGSKEGQKEIFMGIVLAAMGLPSFVKTNADTGKQEFGLGWTGGVKDYQMRYKQNKETVDDLVKYMNQNPEAVQAIKTNFDMLVDQKNANDERDFAIATNNDYAYKNADHDAFFSFVFHRMKGGYYGDVVDGINEIRDMDNDAFEEMFGYQEDTADMSVEERKNFLTDRKAEVADSHLERAARIKELYDNSKNLRVGEKYRKALIHAYSSAKDVDEREESLLRAVEDITGETMAEVEDRGLNDKQSSETLFSIYKDFVMSKLSKAAIDVMENSETGRKIKTRLGIKQFTKAGDPLLVYQELSAKAKQLEEQAAEYEKNGNDDMAFELLEELDVIREQLFTLHAGIQDGTAPNLSEEEQQILEDYKKKDPVGYEQNKEDLTTMLQDLRRLRARRHKMLNLVQQLIDPEASGDTVQRIETAINDITQNEDDSTMTPDQRTRARKYRGKIVDFEYTDKDGNTKSYRVSYKDESDKGLVAVPDAETFKLLKKLSLLEKKKNKTEDDYAEIDLIKEELKGKTTEYKTYNADFLDSAKNIKVVSIDELNLEALSAVIEVLENSLSENLEKGLQEIYETKFQLLQLSDDLIEVKKAIQNAKANKQGALYVNLNKIGKKGNFSVKGAQQVLFDMIQKEKELYDKLAEYELAVEELEENSLKMQVITSLTTNPEAVSDILNAPATQEDALGLINAFLGLESTEEFYRDLLSKEYFNREEILDLLKTTSKDGDVILDRQILQELLDLAAKDNITKEYLDLVNSDLASYRDELNTLAAHRKDVQRLLDKMINPNTGEVNMFPEEGLEPSDLNYLQRELEEIDQDVALLEDVIAMMESETETYLKEQLETVGGLIAQRRKAQEYEQVILGGLNAYYNWLNSILEPMQSEVEEENPKEPATPSIQREGLEALNAFSPSLQSIPLTKTIGKHDEALRMYSFYQEKLDRGEKLPINEQMHFNHVMSQLRFFRASEQLTDWTKESGAKLMVVSRYNIPDNLKDKIVFYDENRSKEEYTKRFRYVDDLKLNEDRDQSKENIKLVLVDKNLEPILVDGEVAYADMPSADVFNAETGAYRYSEKDLDENGELLPIVRDVIDAHTQRRNKILQMDEPGYVYITGKGKSMPIWEDGNPESRGAILGRIVNKQEDLKDVNLTVAQAEQGSKSALLSIAGEQWSVPNGFAFFGTNSRGLKGNLVPAKLDAIGYNRARNLYNLIRLFARSEMQMAEGNERIDLGGKGIETILKEQIFYGKRAKDRQLTEYSFWLENDNFYFGNQGKYISIDQLNSPKENQQLHEDFVQFLSGLNSNINSTRLNKDIKARAAARNAKSKAIRDAKKKGNQDAIKAAFQMDIAPEYEGFTEVLADESGNISTVEWQNYTEYLVSQQSPNGDTRAIEDVPVKVNMPLDMSNSKNVEQATVPQFMGMYIKHNGDVFTASNVRSKTESSSKARQKEESIVVEVNEEGIVESTEYTPEELDKASKEIDSNKKKEFVRVVNKDGEVVWEGMVNTVDSDDLSADAQSALEGTPKERLEINQENTNLPPGFESGPQETTEEDEDDIDAPFFLESQSYFESKSSVNLNAQLEWYNKIMPKDSQGNPIIPLRMIRGLIDGKGYGKFTKDGRILLSSEMDVEGVVYHEAFHGVTRKLLPTKDRYKLYDEVRRMRGQAKNFKGELKKLSEFTDKEADEWLAEEFRQYVIADGNYKVGERVRKSFIDRMFDFIMKALNFFIQNQSQAQTLMSQIHSGYFANPSNGITMYDSNSEAYMEGKVISPTLKNNAMEGMTVIMFNKAMREGSFEMQDFFTVDPEGKHILTKSIRSLYGGPGLGKGTIYSQMLGHLRVRERQITASLEAAATERQKEFLSNQLENVAETRELLSTNWGKFKAMHEAYLERYAIDLQELEEIDESDKNGRAFDIPSHEMDPNLSLPHSVRLLISTLPARDIDPEGNDTFVYNSSGFPQLVDFGKTMAFLYKELSNKDPKYMLNILRNLAEERHELKSLLTRMSLENDNMDDHTFRQARMVIQALIQFDQSNNTFYTQMLDNQGNRYLLNSNSNRIDRLIKDAWRANFRDSLETGFGEIVEGKIVIDTSNKVNVNGKIKTLKEWGTFPKTSLEAVGVLSAIGVKFSDPIFFMSEYDTRNEVKNAVNWIIKELDRASLSDIYEGDIQANLKTLLDIESETTKFAIDLQHRNPEGKTVHGISLKTSADVILSELNGNQEKITEMLQYDNLRNSLYLQSMLSQNTELKLAILEGPKQEFGKGKPLSKSTPADVAIMHFNAVLRDGIVPLIRTSDKKTEYGLQYKTPTLQITPEIMLDRLKGYLEDEIRTANNFNINKKSRLKNIKTYNEQAGDLRFFKNIVNIPQITFTKKLSEQKIQTLIDKATPDLAQWIEESTKGVIDTMMEFNLVAPGKQGKMLNIGIDWSLARDVKNLTQDPNINTSYISEESVGLLAEQFLFEHTTGLIEQSKIFFGDLALYSDIFKRTSGLVGTKKYPTQNPSVVEWMNLNMPNLGFAGREHSNTVRTVHRKGVDVDGQYLQQYIDVLSVMNPGLIDLIKDTYQGMEEFDGGGFAHLDFYRGALFRVGQWSPKQEELYQKIMSGENINSEDITFFPPLKPQVFAPFIEDNVRLMTFHKFALFPLIPQLMPGRTYDQINEDMVANETDYMVFDSVVKVGAVQEDTQRFDSFYTRTGDFMSYKPMSIDEDTGQPSALQEYSFNHFGIQVDMAPKIKTKVTLGTQSRSLMALNIFEDGQISGRYIESGLGDAVAEFNGVNSAMILRSMDSLAAELGLEKVEEGYKLRRGSAREFSNALLSELNKRDMPEHTKRGIEMLMKQDNKFINKLFEKNKIETILYALVTNSSVRLKMPGDLMVLQAATGLEVQARALKQNDFDKAKELGVDLQNLNLKPLKFYRKDATENATPEQLANSKTLAMQVMLPHRFKELGLGNVVDINKVNPKLRQLIGFRIPTEELNSIDFIEVVGYLPPSAGSAIIVPSEIVGKAGSDYDIDKLTVYMPNYFIDSEGRPAYVPYLNNENSSVEERFDLMKETNPKMFEDMSLQEFSQLPMPSQNTMAALQNRYQELMRTVLENPISFDRLITPVGAFELKDLANRIADQRIKNGKGKPRPKDFSKILSFNNLVNQSYRMWSGLGGTGIVATSATQHAKSQRANIKWNADADIQINFPGDNLSLARVSDTEGKRTISSVIAQYVTGYVDVTKEDFVFDINAGVQYAPVHMMLLRSGVPLESVLYFMSQPVIDDYVKLMETTTSLSAQIAPGRIYNSRRDIETKLKGKYGSAPETPTLLRDDTMLSMIGKNLEDMTPVEKQLQAQVLADFIRYNEYSDELYLMQQGTTFDTSRLQSSVSIKYVQASLARVIENNMIENINNLITNPDTQMMAAMKMVFDKAPSMFSELDMKEKFLHISRFFDTKMYELTDKNKYISRDDAIYTMSRFDTFLSSYIVQTTPISNSKLNSRISALFQGENSLPNKIRQAKGNPKYANNLLLQELYPVLQKYKDAKDPKFGIDNMKLFTKKLQAFDADLLADSYMELKDIDPTLARNIIEFSLLQSGFNYSPIAFFQVLPSTEVLEVLGPLFDSNPLYNLKIEDVWHEFNQNSFKDSRIVPRLRYRINPKNEDNYKNGIISTNRASADYITVSLPTGETTVVGTVEKNVYDVKLFAKVGVDPKNKNNNLYRETIKKGDGINLIEAGVENSVLKSNRSKYGLDEFKMPIEVENKVHDNEKLIVPSTKLMPGGRYITPNGGLVLVQFAGKAPKMNKIQKDLAAVDMGYENFKDLRKAGVHKAFVAGKTVYLYELKSLEYGQSHAKRDDYDAQFAADQSTEGLFDKAAVVTELNKILEEKDNCKLN